MDFPISDATTRLLAGRYTDGNPLTATPASRHDSNTHNRIIDSILAVQAAAGLTPAEANVNQLRDAILQLLNQGPVKTPVRAATTANIASLAGGAPNTLDGVTLAASDRILVKDQTTASQNGLYVVTTLGTGANGTWTRATDADGVGEFYGGMLVIIQEGTLYADTVWEIASPTGAIIVGATGIVFQQISSQNAQPSITGSVKNLQASATGLNANVIVSADEIVLKAGVGQYKTVESVSLTIAGTANGANGLDTGVIAASTWYSLWVIWNGATVAGLMSLSATAPTMPSGYTHKSRVGWIRADGTVNKFPLSFIQFGKNCQYKIVSASNLTAFPVCASGTFATATAATVSPFVPPTAAKIKLILNISGATNTGTIGSNALSVLGQFGVGTGGSYASINLPIEFYLESSNIFFTGQALTGSISGWEDIF